MKLYIGLQLYSTYSEDKNQVKFGKVKIKGDLSFIK